MLLDANIFFLPVQHRFPLEAEVARLRPGAVLGVPRSVLSELDRLVREETPSARAARALASRVRAVPSEGRGDAAILAAAVRLAASVVTADRELGVRLRACGVDVLVPRDRHRLEVRPARARRPPPVRRPDRR